ncbi:hypothetical protein BDV59DRAFT_61505 [Aspergillus ambiguus]|uniref:uncharacterized protein n=1 Tax=Aspergillus ambiguus TaxID=176160 RepID=UPI003CCD649F
MSLKRKASLSAIGSPDSPTVLPGCGFMMDDSPKHLHSRTRKRFRNDRPDEKVVYANTLRWLFTAQQNHQTLPPMSITDEGNDVEYESLPTPETLDPRQQTLHKFFQPSQPTFHPTKIQANTQSDNSFLQPHIFSTSSSTITPEGSDMTSPSSREPYTDIDMDMDVDVDVESRSDESVQATERRAGGLAWMGHPRVSQPSLY